MTKFILGFSKLSSYGADMRPYEELAATALAELDRCRSLLRTATRWDAPTPCVDWSVHDLTTHLAAVAWQQGEAFGRARIAVAETPSYLTVAGDGPSAVDALDLAAEQLRTHVDAVAGLAADTMIPLGAGTFPAQIAAAILVFEYGIHRNDVQRALGAGPDDELDPVVAETVMALMPLGMFARLAQPAEEPLAYRIVGDSGEAALGWTGEGWSSAPEALTDACTIRGTDAAVVLAALGRLPVDHAALTIDDPAGIAPSFRRHFGGI